MATAVNSSRDMFPFKRRARSISSIVLISSASLASSVGLVPLELDALMIPIQTSRRNSSNVLTNSLLAASARVKAYGLLSGVP